MFPKGQFGYTDEREIKLSPVKYFNARRLHYSGRFATNPVAMVKQLGIPTWFMTLSCADLRWPELFQIIARTQGKNMTDEQAEALSYNE